MPDYNTKNNHMVTVVTIAEYYKAPQIYSTKLFKTDKEALEYINAAVPTTASAVIFIGHLLTIDESTINY